MYSHANDDLPEEKLKIIKYLLSGESRGKFFVKKKKTEMLFIISSKPIGGLK